MYCITHSPLAVRAFRKYLSLILNIHFIMCIEWQRKWHGNQARLASTTTSCALVAVAAAAAAVASNARTRSCHSHSRTMTRIDFVVPFAFWCIETPSSAPVYFIAQQLVNEANLYCMVWLCVWASATQNKRLKIQWYTLHTLFFFFAPNKYRYIDSNFDSFDLVFIVFVLCAASRALDTWKFTFARRVLMKARMFVPLWVGKAREAAKLINDLMWKRFSNLNMKCVHTVRHFKCCCRRRRRFFPPLALSYSFSAHVAAGYCDSLDRTKNGNIFRMNCY